MMTCMSRSLQRLRNLIQTPGPLWRRAGYLDLVAAVLWAALAGAAFLLLPDGSILRVILAVGVLFLVPGYLVIEAVAGIASSPHQRSVRALVAFGVSPPIVGLLALATAIIPGAFKPLPIVATITVACVIFAAFAMLRRLSAVQGVPARPSITA